MLMRIFTNGTPLWIKKYHGTSGSTIYASSVVATPDGYVISGSNRTEKFHNNLIKTDLEGNLVWEKDYEDTMLILSAYPSFVYAVEDGYYYIGTNSAGDNVNILLLKTDADGNALWVKKFSGEGDADTGAVTPVSNGFVIAGLTGTSSEHYLKDLYLVKVDLNGNMIWDKTYSGLSSLRSMIADNNTYVIIGTENKTVYPGDPIMIKTTQDTGSKTGATPTPFPGVEVIAAIFLGTILCAITRGRRNN